jgi:lysophospholipase L1-like esterase
VKNRVSIFAIAALAVLPSVALAQKAKQPVTAQHWVSTWATPLELMQASFPGGGGGRAGRGGPPPNGAPGPNGNAAQPPSQGMPNGGRALPNVPPAPGNGPTAQAPARPPQGRGGSRPENANIPPTLADQTVRMVVRTSLGGKKVRIELSNRISAQPLEVGAAHVAVYTGGGKIAPGTDRALTFSGNPTCTVQPGVLLVSDPVDLDVAPHSDLAVSLYVASDSGAPTNHTISLHTNYISKGNVAGSEIMPDPAETYAYLWLSSVDVLAPLNAFTVVALGDSITDGYATTRDANLAWPYLLAKRFAANKATQHIAVVNQGISGNQVLRDGAGVSALSRFDRDVLSRPGVKWIILLEGINDINIRGRGTGPTALTAEELIAGYRQIIERAHMHGIKVIGATIMPEEGVPTASPRGEEIRLATNKWIRAKGNFDAVVDFDATVQDPSHPAKIRQDLDPGDHIHPNDKANQAMADAFDLAIFTK